MFLQLPSETERISFEYFNDEIKDKQYDLKYFLHKDIYKMNYDITMRNIFEYIKKSKSRFLEHRRDCKSYFHSICLSKPFGSYILNEINSMNKPYFNDLFYDFEWEHSASLI